MRRAGIASWTCNNEQAVAQRSRLCRSGWRTSRASWKRSGRRCARGFCVRSRPVILSWSGATAADSATFERRSRPQCQANPVPVPRAQPAPASRPATQSAASTGPVIIRIGTALPRKRMASHRRMPGLSGRFPSALSGRPLIQQPFERRSRPQCQANPVPVPRVPVPN